MAVPYRVAIGIGAGVLALIAVGRSRDDGRDAATGEPVVLTQPGTSLPAAAGASLGGFTGSLDLAAGQVATPAVVRIEPMLPPDVGSLVATVEPIAPAGTGAPLALP